MRRTLLAALPLALLVLAAPAAAKDGRKHTTYRAAIAPVAAEEPTASPSRRGHVEARGAEVRGKAVLVDGRKRDRVKLRVRGLDRGTAYTWEVRQGGCAGEAVGGFRYRALKVRRGGAKGRGVSRSFTAAAGASYALVVSGPDGAVACGEFERKGGKKKRGGEDVEPPACEDVPADHEGLDDSGDEKLGGDDEPVAKRATDDRAGDGCDDESAGDDFGDDGADDSADDDPGDDDADDDFEDDDF
jgi:hypothetical protein